MGVGAMECVARCHAAHRKEVQFLCLPAELCHGFIPIDLRFLAEGITLRNEDFRSSQTQLTLALPDVSPHLRFRDLYIRKLGLDSGPNPMCRVALFPWSVLIGIQN